MNNRIWIVMNIGYIECGVSSQIAAIVFDEEEANKIAEQLQESHHWREGGQNSFQVFEIDINQVGIHPDYLTKPEEKE